MTNTVERANGVTDDTPEMNSHEVRFDLNVTPEQLGRIRRIITAHVRCWGQEQIIDQAVMCATEMLSNVERHVESSDCVLILRSSPSGVRIAVSDDSQELPVVREPDWCSERGRGMWLLSKTAVAWGADLTDQGKDVWVELQASAKGAVV
ncbi:ATP-binding protein [Streptomyces cucumeris]|uniref:ATP-binding protein n=1 Tax=Streptomyces cucumeris TaxID=2962890 RepID=UPI003D74AB26